MYIVVIDTCILVYSNNRCTLLVHKEKPNVPPLCCIMCYTLHYEQHKISRESFRINIFAKFNIQNKTSE